MIEQTRGVTPLRALLQNHRGDWDLSVNTRLDGIGNGLLNSGMAFQSVFNGSGKDVDAVEDHHVVDPAMEDEWTVLDARK